MKRNLRAVISTSTAAAALVLAAPALSAGHSPEGGIPCTGSPFDAIVGPYLGNDCGAGTGGGPGDDNGGDTPPPPGALVI